MDFRVALVGQLQAPNGVLYPMPVLAQTARLWPEMLTSSQIRWAAVVAVAVRARSA
jgi:hypothetical protein